MKKLLKIKAKKVDVASDWPETFPPLRKIGLADANNDADADTDTDADTNADTNADVDADGDPSLPRHRKKILQLHFIIFFGIREWLERKRTELQIRRTWVPILLGVGLLSSQTALVAARRL